MKHNTKNKLTCVVTGMEQSGTTYLSRVIMSHPDIWAGFECGVLLGKINNFYKEKPFSEWIEEGGWHYGLGKGASNKISELNNYRKVYEYIYNNMGNTQSDESGDMYKLFKKAKFILDKTPRYSYYLGNIITKIDNEVPIFIIYKDWKQQFYSMVVKRDVKPLNFVKMRTKFVGELKKIISNKNVFVIKYNDLMLWDNKINNFIMEKINYFNPEIKINKISISIYKKKTMQHVQNLKIGTYDFKKSNYIPYKVDKEIIDNKVNNKYQEILRNNDDFLEKHKTIF